MTLDEYRTKGLHLPPEFRDFHDQKDLFKTAFGEREIEGKKLSWRDQHVYSIDFFLWIMAAYGYELRRTTRKVERRNLSEEVEQRRKHKANILKEHLLNH